MVPDYEGADSWLCLTDRKKNGILRNSRRQAGSVPCPDPRGPSGLDRDGDRALCQPDSGHNPDSGADPHLCSQDGGGGGGFGPFRPAGDGAVGDVYQNASGNLSRFYSVSEPTG